MESLLHSRELTCSDGRLEDLLDTRISALVRTVVSSEMYRRRGIVAEDIDDVCSDTLVSLLSWAETAQSGLKPAASIENLEAFVATFARRACSAWSRRRYPAFHRLRTRLRYLLSGDKDFALWEDAQGVWVCGLAAWQIGTTRPRTLQETFLSRIDASGQSHEVLRKIFQQASQPIYFNELAKLCAQLWDVNDTTETLEAVEQKADPAEEPASTLDHSQYLKRLWTELRDLPPRQSAALLLNLRASGGECATSLLVLTGTATLDEVAQVLGLPGDLFAALWSRLPLNDLEIATQLQLTRQQVINLRKCARERLRRRLGADRT